MADEGLSAYRQYEEIGAGSHSRVYKARKRLGIEFVALRKVDKSRQPKLLNEVRALGELRHGNVLAFHGWYYTERHLWVVSEYCAGGDLASLLAHDGQLPEPTVVSLGLDALAALQHVHSRGFLAVDLTPNAFLLNESGLLKLSDFGASRHIHEASAPPPHQLIAAMGADLTPSYLAPEILAPTPAHSPRARSAHSTSPSSAPDAPPPRACFSHASDFWALGVLLHHMAAGQPPFASSASLSARLLAAATQPTPELPGASLAFSQLQRALLQKDPTLRPSWEEMREHAFWSGCLGRADPPIPSQPLYEEWVEAKRRRREEARVAAAQRKAAEREAEQREAAEREAARREAASADSHSDATTASGASTNAASGARATDARPIRDGSAPDASAPNSTSPAAPAAMAHADTGVGTPRPHGSAYRPAGAKGKGAGRSGAGSGGPRTRAFPRVASRLPAEMAPTPQGRTSPAPLPIPVGIPGAPSLIPRPTGLRETSRRETSRGGREQPAGAGVERVLPDADVGGGGAEARCGSARGRGSMGDDGGRGASEARQEVIAPLPSGFAPACGSNPSGGQGDVIMAPSTISALAAPAYTVRPPTPVAGDARGGGARSVCSSEDGEAESFHLHREGAGVTPSDLNSLGPLEMQPISPGTGLEQVNPSTQARQVDIAVAATRRAEAQAAAEEVAAAKLAAAGALAALRRALPGELHLSRQAAVTDAADARGAAASAVPAAMSELMQIVFHPSEWSIKPIALNPSIEAPSPTERLEPRALPFKPHSAEALLAMWPDQIEAALLPVVRSLGGGVAGIPSHSTTSAEKSSAVLYCESLAPEPRAATMLLNSPLATLLARILLSAPSAALRLRVASLLAALLRHSTLLDRGIVLHTILPALLEGLRDRAVMVRRRGMAALGEVIYYAAVQQEHAAPNIEHDGLTTGDAGATARLGTAAGREAEAAAEGPAWQLPPAALDTLTAALRDEDAPTLHYAVRTVENVLMRASEGLGGDVAAALCTEGVLEALLEAVGRRSAAGVGGVGSGGNCSVIGGGGSGGGAGPNFSSLRVSAAAAVAQLLRLRPDLTAQFAADGLHMSRILAQMREAGNPKPAQAAVTCLLLLLRDADARRALAASASEPQRRQMIATVLALTRRPHPLLQSKGCLAAALLSSLGTPWLNHAVQLGLLTAIEAVCDGHPAGNTMFMQTPTGTFADKASCGKVMPLIDTAHEGTHGPFAALVTSAVRRILASLHPALLRLVATPHLAPRLPPASPDMATHTHRSPAAAAALTPATPSSAKPSRPAPSCAAPAPAAQASYATSWEPPDTEAALALLLALAQCAPIASAMAPPPTLSALAACLHALCHVSEPAEPGGCDDAGAAQVASPAGDVAGVERLGVSACNQGGHDDPSSSRDRVAASVRLALRVATHVISAADPPALAALAAHAPQHLCPHGLLGALCRCVGTWDDTPTRLQAIHAAAALAHATVAGSPRAASAVVAPTLLSHLLPHLPPILEDALRSTQGPLELASPSDEPQLAPASDSARGVSCITLGECTPLNARTPADTRTPAKVSTSLGTCAPPDSPLTLEAARSLLLLLSAIPSPPSDIAHAIDRLSLVPVLCRTLHLLSLTPSSFSNSHCFNNPTNAHGGSVCGALQTPHAFAPLLRALAERPAVALRLGLAPMLASIISPSVPHQPAQPASHDTLHLVLDAAYLLLCFGVSVCRKHEAAFASRPSPSRPPTPRLTAATSSPAAALATAVAEQLRPLADCAATLLSLLDPTVDARLAEKAAHCQLQICELLALVDPQTAAAAVLGAGLRLRGSVTAGSTALTAALATGARSELSRCIGRFMAVLRAADEPSFIAAMAAMPGLAKAMSAAADAL